MLKPFLFLLTTAALFAQNPADLFQKAPPAVDQALRERITRFYQLHVDGKFRQAEALVSEECKDFFYSVNKPNYISVEIRDIDWSDNFTKAKATIVAQMRVMLPGFTDKPFPVPFPSRWKLVNNEWYWYVNLDEVHDTPFGRMKSGTAGAAPVPGALPSEQEMAKVMQQVKVDKPSVELKGKEPSTAQFGVTNDLPGDVRLSVETPASAGFRAELAKTELKPGEKTTITVEWKATREAPYYLQFVLRVSPTNQVIPLRVNFVK